MQSKNAILREALNSGKPMVLPSAFDPLTAGLIQNVGFPAVYLGGAQTGYSMCVPEPMVTVAEQAALASRCAARLRVPLITDAQDGFGDATHVVRTVQEFEHAGLSGIHIEDQVYPKRVHYFRGVERIIPLEDFLVKMRYALSARRDPDFVIIARTDARNAVGGSFEECVRRGRALKELGVDAIVPMLKDPEELQEFRRLVPDIPLVAFFRWDSAAPTHEFHKWGYQMIFLPVSVQLGAMTTVLSLLQTLRDTGVVALESEVVEATRKWVEACQDLEGLLQIERETTERPA